jgi:hypothetical protein
VKLDIETRMNRLAAWVFEERSSSQGKFKFSERVKSESISLIQNGVRLALLSKRTGLASSLILNWNKKKWKDVSPPMRLQVIEETVLSSHNSLSKSDFLIELSFPSGVAVKGVPWNSSVQEWLKELI